MTTGNNVLNALQSYRLKRSGDKWRCDSPFRPNSDSMGFAVKIDPDGEHGAFFDHVTQESGTLYELAQRLGVQIERAQVQDTKRQYAGIADYAAAHGIPVSALLEAGWSEVTYDYRGNSRNALKIPTANGVRYRFLDGESPVYISPKGYQRCWYGLERAIEIRQAANQPLILCNGEISTVAAQWHNLAATAVTAGEKSGIPADLVTVLKSVYQGRVIVAYDCDEAGIKAAVQLVRQLNDNGFDAYAVDLNLSKGGDLADFCLLHGENALNILLHLPPMAVNAESSATKPITMQYWRLVHADGLANLPPLTWLVQSELPAKGLVTLFGQSGSGKSFVAIDYALNIAQDKVVIYIAAEGEYGYHKRVLAWTQFHRLTAGNLYFCLGAVNLLTKTAVDQFLSQITALNPVLVIVDTMARCMVGGDENSARDMSILIDHCAHIQRTISGTVLLVHHVAKQSGFERGSSALRAACDAMIKVNLDDDVIEVESSKTKDEKPFETRRYRLVTVKLLNDEESAVLVPAEQVTQTSRDPLSPNQRKILNVLRLADFDNGAPVGTIANQVQIPEPSVRSVLSRLTKLGYVSRRTHDKTTAYLYWLNDDQRKMVEGDQGDQSLLESRSPHTTTENNQGDQSNLAESEVSADFLAIGSTDHIDQLDQIPLIKVSDLRGIYGS